MTRRRPFDAVIFDCDGVLVDAGAILLTGAVASGDLVLSTERFSARRRGHTLDQDVCVVWRIANGRCVELWSRFAAQAACDHFRDGSP